MISRRVLLKDQLFNRDKVGKIAVEILGRRSVERVGAKGRLGNALGSGKKILTPACTVLILE